MPEVVGLHKLLRARGRAVLQNVPRTQVRSQGLRIRRRRRMPVHGRRRTIQGRDVSTYPVLDTPAARA